jgi:hypothetical protein
MANFSSVNTVLPSKTLLRGTRAARATSADIDGDSFLVNGQLTLKGCRLEDVSLEGLLLNSRFVQAIFDDLNPETRGRWAYPDGPWNAERNTDAFIAQMPVWAASGLNAFTLNLQGGSPEGYSRGQPWENSSFAPDGSLRPAYMARLERVLDHADALGFVVILGLFYFGQDGRLRDEAAVLHAADNAVDWLLERHYTNVLVEIANECDINDVDETLHIGVDGSFSYEHAILCAPRAHELIEHVQRRSTGRVGNRAGRLLVSTSYRGSGRLRENVARVADFILLHGNSVPSSAELIAMIQDSRGCAGYRGQPITINEDDHYDFEHRDCHYLSALRARVGWGLFDFRAPHEGFESGYQSVPVDWTSSTQRKRAFFDLTSRLAGKS